MRLLARLALCILASLPWQAPQASAAAQAQPASLAQLLRMRQNLPERPLRVAQVAHPPGQQESNGSRILNGISDDYLRFIGDFLALPLERITYPSVEASFAGLRNGEVDLLPRASDFERHLPGLIFSHPYLNSTPIIIGRSDDQSLPPDLQGKRVLLLNHYLHPDTVRQAYPGAILESVRGTAAGLQRLAEGGADAFLGDKTRANRYMLQRPDLKLQNKFAANLPSEGFAFAALASRRDLVTLVDHALETTPDTRKHEFLQRWTPSRQLFAPTDAFALSHGEREWLKKKQPLRLIAQSAPPYFFRNSHGQWDGLGLDVLRYLSDAYELPLEILDAQSPAQDQRRLERARRCSPAASRPPRSAAAGWPSACRSGSRTGPSSSAATPVRPVRWRPWPGVDWPSPATIPCATTWKIATRGSTWSSPPAATNPFPWSKVAKWTPRCRASTTIPAGSRSTACARASISRPRPRRRSSPSPRATANCSGSSTSCSATWPRTAMPAPGCA